MNVKQIYCNASCWVLQIDSLSRIYNGFAVEQKIEPESVMISFRAPGDVATLLNNAEIVTDAKTVYQFRARVLIYDTPKP